MRLITYGCSYTYGQWLETEDMKGLGLSPPASAWPSQLAKLLGWELDNRAVPGSSNKQIWYTILQNTHKPDDRIVVHWSHIERSCILHQDRIEKIGPWRKGVSEQYYRYCYSDWDTNCDSNMRISHAMDTLNRQAIPSWHCPPPEDVIPDCQVPATRRELAGFSNHSTEIQLRKQAERLISTTSRGLAIKLPFNVFTPGFERQEFADLALDNLHPGKGCHEWLAKKLVDFVR